MKAFALFLVFLCCLILIKLLTLTYEFVVAVASLSGLGAETGKEYFWFGLWFIILIAAIKIIAIIDLYDSVKRY